LYSNPKVQSLKFILKETESQRVTSLANFFNESKISKGWSREKR